MITVSVDVDALASEIAGELQALAKFAQDMGEELVAWQREDMRRQYPNVTETEDAASTDIWPRSRIISNASRDQRRAMRRAMRYAPMRRSRGMAPARMPAGAGVQHSTRPILRPELFDQLEERMDNLMLEKLAWP